MSPRARSSAAAACWRGRWREAIKRFCCGPRYSPLSLLPSPPFPTSLLVARRRRLALSPSRGLPRFLPLPGWLAGARAPRSLSTLLRLSRRAPRPSPSGAPRAVSISPVCASTTSATTTLARENQSARARVRPLRPPSLAASAISLSKCTSACKLPLSFSLSRALARSSASVLSL